MLYEFRPTSPVSAEVTEALKAIGGPTVRRGLIKTPVNAAWVVQRILDQASVGYRVTTPPMAPEFSPLHTLSGLRPWVADWLRPFQRDGLHWAVRGGDQHGSGILWWSPGSGKTAAGILWGLYGPGRVVIVTRASVRRQYAREIERLTTERVRVIEGESTATWTDSDRFLVVSWEGLPHHVDALIKDPHLSVVFDELHKGKSHKRFQAITPEEGEQLDFRLLANVAASAMRLSRAANRRLGTSASPQKDRIRDHWAQLDLVYPGAFGNFYIFARRYCDAHQGRFGGIDTSGMGTPEQLAELARRLWFCAHAVPETVSHAQLPPKRSEVVYIRPEDQDAPGGFAEELRRAAKGAGSMREVRLAEAASRKRSATTERVVEALIARQKVVVFTGRQRDCERLFEAVRKALIRAKITGAWIAAAHGAGTAIQGPDQTQPLDAEHPALPRGPGDLDLIKDAYMATTDTACLIGTHKVWGEGHNLDDTDLAIGAMLPETPGDLTQIRGRFHRLSMKRPTLMLWLVAEGTEDDRQTSILIDKLDASSAVMAGLTGDQDASTMRTMLVGEEGEVQDDLWNKIAGPSAEKGPVTL